MPTNTNNVYYQDPVALSGGSLTPQVVSADVSLPATPFPTQGAMNLFAQLNTHEFYRSSMTGAQNDLDFIARLPGDQNLAIRFVDPAANNATLSIATTEPFLTTVQGSNKDLTFVSKDSSKAITIEYKVGAAGAPLSVAVTGNAISITALTTDPGVAADSTASEILAAVLASAPAAALVTASLATGSSGAGKPSVFAPTALAGGAVAVNLATGVAGAITSTAAQVKAAIEANTAATALMIVNLAASNDGTGIVIALAQTQLGGPFGTNPTLDVTLKEGVTVTGTLATNAAFAQKTTATTESKKFLNVMPYGQWLLDVGGTNPVFAVSIDVVYNPN